MANSNNWIQISRNQIVIETIQKFSNHSYLTCVNQFDAENDIFELRSQGSGEVSKFFFFKFEIIILIFDSYQKATISVKTINEGIPTKFKFGKNRDLDLIKISSNNTTCDENFEIARTILIQNGEILGSACVTKHILVLSTHKSSNIPKMIVFPQIIGKYLV